MPFALLLRRLVLLTLPMVASTLAAEPLPAGLQGTWRIARILPTSNVSCWGREQAVPLVGSTLTYHPEALRWRGGEVALDDVVTRRVSAADFARENGSASFAQIGIRAQAVLEIDLQHEDMDITGATTEVPGDSVLLAAPNRIVVSACGVFFEATRASAMGHTTLRR